jgi:hypothetical protein
MFIILEHNGDYGLMVNEKGENETFDTYTKANEFAIKNCAFEYKIVEL